MLTVFLGNNISTFDPKSATIIDRPQMPINHIGCVNHCAWPEAVTTYFLVKIVISNTISGFSMSDF